jgi:rhodanese-related sulfurtransferase
MPYLLLGLAFCALFLTSCGSSPSVKEITPERLKALMAAGEPLVVIDTRAGFEFEHGRIPGAVNVPQEQFPSLRAILPKDKGINLVFYCRGYG